MGVEIDEPVPTRVEAEEDGGPVEGGGEGGGSPLVGEVWAANNINIASGAEDWDGADGEGEAAAEVVWGGEVEVEEVAVVGVVDGEEKAEEAVGVGAGEEVGDGRRRRGGVEAEVVEVGVGGRGRSTAGEGEDEENGDETRG